jgi:hypothetical protein
MRRSPFRILSLAICSFGIFFSNQSSTQAGLIPDVAYALFGPAGSPYFPGAYSAGYAPGYNTSFYSPSYSSYYAPSYTSYYRPYISYYTPSYSSYYSPSCSSCNCSPCSCSPCACNSCGSCGSCASGACSSGNCSSGRCGYAGGSGLNRKLTPKPEKAIPPSPYDDYDRSNKRNNNERIEEYKQPVDRGNELKSKTDDGFEDRGNGSENILDSETPNPLDNDIKDNEKKDEFLLDGDEDETTTFKKPVTIKQKKAPVKTNPQPAELKTEDNPVKEGVPGAKEEGASKLPRLEVKPLNVGRTITWRAAPEMKRLNVHSRFNNPVVARSIVPLKKRTVGTDIYIVQK